MSAMKAFIDDQHYYYLAGLEAGSENNMWRLAEDLSGVGDDASAYANPDVVAITLSEALYLGWQHGQRGVDTECVAPLTV
jgi:hypothetical protein